MIWNKDKTGNLTLLDSEGATIAQLPKDGKTVCESHKASDFVEVAAKIKEPYDLFRWVEGNGAWYGRIENFAVVTIRKDGTILSLNTNYLFRLQKEDQASILLEALSAQLRLGRGEKP